MKPVVDGRRSDRKGAAWVNDLFSTRQDYTQGVIYNSRLNQTWEKTTSASTTASNSNNNGDDGNDSNGNHLSSHTSLQPATHVQVEAERDYLFALRSAIENQELHRRIILETNLVGTLTRIRQQNRQSEEGGDLVIAALTTEVFGLACHSPILEVREFLLDSDGTKLVLQFVDDAVKMSRGYSTRLLQHMCVAASALASLSTLKKAPRKFGRAGAFRALQAWKRTTSNMHISECFANVLFNVALSTPRSHVTYWLDSLLSIVSEEFVGNDGTQDETRHLCLQMTQIMVRVMEVQGVPGQVTKGRTKVINHSLVLLENAEVAWTSERGGGGNQWESLLESVCAMVHLVTSSTKAVAHTCDNAEENVLGLIRRLVRIGFDIHDSLRRGIHDTCIAAIGNVARTDRFRHFLIEGGAVDMIDQIMSSAVKHQQSHQVAQCVVALRTLASDNASNTDVVKLGGLNTLLKAFRYSNGAYEHQSGGEGSVDPGIYRVEILTASCICGMMSCSDIGELVKAIGNDVTKILREMLRQRDMLLRRHPQLLGPFVTMIRNMSCTSVGLKIYSKLPGLAKTLVGMSKLIPMPVPASKIVASRATRSTEKTSQVVEDGEAREAGEASSTIQNNKTWETAGSTTAAAAAATSTFLPASSSRTKSRPRWHPVWGPDAKGKLGGPKDDDLVMDEHGNTVKNPEALEQEYRQMRVSVAATLFNMSTLKRCCTHQIAKPHMIKYFKAIMEGDNGDGTYAPTDDVPRMPKVQEYTVAALLEISRIFKTAGQQFSELGVIESLVELATKNLSGDDMRSAPEPFAKRGGERRGGGAREEESKEKRSNQEEDIRAALNASVLAVSTMCALTALDCNADVLIRHQVPQALLMAGSRASSPQPIRLRCAIALNNLVYHHPFIFTKEIILLQKDRRMHRRAGFRHVESRGVGSSAMGLPGLTPEKLKILRMPGAFSLPLTSNVDGQSKREKSINATMFLSMLGDVDGHVRSYATSAVCHLIMREPTSHKWIVRSGGVHQTLMTGLLRASRDEQETRRRAILAFLKLCSEAGRKWLRRRPFTTPRVVWAATSMIRDGDYHKTHPQQRFGDTGEVREQGLILLLYLSATPQGRVLVGNGSTLKVIVETGLRAVSRKEARPDNALALLRLCVRALVNLCCGIGSGVLASPRDDRGALRRLDDDGSTRAYDSEMSRRGGLFESIARGGLVEKIVELAEQCNPLDLKVELGSVLASLVLAEQVPFHIVEEARVLPCLLELTKIDPKAPNSVVDLGHWTSLQEHATLAAFHISELSRRTRDYVIRLAQQACIDLVLMPIQAHTFTNRSKDLCLRSLETFAREPSLRPLVLSCGLLKFVNELVSQHQGPVILHRRSMIISRIVRLVTRRFPRSVTFKPAAAKEHVVVGDLGALFGSDSEEEDEGEGGRIDEEDEKDEKEEKKKNAGKKGKSGKNALKCRAAATPDATQEMKSVWHTLATKSIVSLLLKLASSEGDNLGVIHVDCSRTLRNLTEDSDARIALAKLPSERERILELADVFVDAELEYGARSGSKASGFRNMTVTGVDHVSWALSNLLCVPDSRRAFIEGDVLLTLEAVCVSTAATETSIEAASKAVLALMVDDVGGGGDEGVVVAEKDYQQKDYQREDYQQEDYQQEDQEEKARYVPSSICCNEIIEVGGHKTIRGMFEEVRRQRISMAGARRLGLALLLLLEYCQREMLSTPPDGFDPVEMEERKEMLVKAEIDMLKATTGDLEKLKALSEVYSDELMLEMCTPSVLLQEDDVTKGSPDLGRLVGFLPRLERGTFVAKFTRVVPWLATAFSTFPDVPQGMRLQHKPAVVRPWLLNSEESTSGTSISTSKSGSRKKVAPLTGYNGIMLSDAVKRVQSLYEVPSALDLDAIQEVAKRTTDAETRRQLLETEVEMRKQTQFKRLQIMERNLDRWRVIDEKRNKLDQERMEYKKNVSWTANETIADVAQQSSKAVEHKRNKTKFMSAHTKSAIRLQKLEATATILREDCAASFVAQMRERGEQTLLTTRRQVLSTMGTLLR